MTLGDWSLVVSRLFGVAASFGLTVILYLMARNFDRRP